MFKPTVLLILDGWGIAPTCPGNAISHAKIPQLTKLWQSFPHTKLAASGEAVGLPKGEDGNTETGHLNIGAGRVVYQDLPRINMAIADGSFFQNEALLSAVSHAQGHMSNIHLLGLIGSGGVHSNLEHLYALLWFFRNQNFNRVYLHLITDGRDSPPKSAITFVAQINEEIKRVGIGTIASIMGRYYAMDRDQRWERTEKAYVALTEGKGFTADTAIDAIEQAYEKNITDEFIEPTLITRPQKQANLIRHNDAVIFLNYRIDRPRQLTKAFVLTSFSQQAKFSGYDPFATKYYKKHLFETSGSEPFKRKVVLENIFFVTMTEYEKKLPVAVAFPPEFVQEPIGKVIAEQGLRQLRCSETEKERFITFYFNGLREEPFEGEDRLIIPSPKVPTYDLKPEMSAYELTEQLLKKIDEQTYDFIFVNIANPDMVGHTGVIPAAIKACEVTDQCVGKIVEKILAKNGACFITADHGNVEEMIDPVTGGIDTEHSTYPVPFICVMEQFEGQPHNLPSGMLADIAPTMLAANNIPVPQTMNGRNLLEHLLQAKY